MTTTYEATDKNCINCGEPVEDYTGHWEASEVTACEECHDEVSEEFQYTAQVIHCVPRKEDDDD